MATPPYITVTYDPPLSSDTGSEFDEKAFDTIGKLNPWGVEANTLADWVGEKADQALAAATGGDLPALTGFGGNFLRVKADESGAEFAEVPEPVTQSTATWEAGTSTTEGIVSPAKVKAAIDEYAIGIGQTWQDVSGSRSGGTAYQNTTGKPIGVSMYTDSSGSDFEVSDTSSAGPWVKVSSGQSIGGTNRNFTSTIVPNSHFYRASGNIRYWVELR